MKQIDRLTVKFNDATVGILALSPDGKLCTFQYDKAWLVSGFSISPFELPLQPGVFVAKSQPFAGNFGVFEDSLPDGYGRYLLHKSLQKQGIDDFSLSAIQRLSIVGNGGMGALTYVPQTMLCSNFDDCDFDVLQQKALQVLSEKNDDDASLLLFNSRNSGGCRPKTLYADADGHWLVKFRHTYDPLDIGKQEYAYKEAARKCGIVVPDFKLIKDKYFASKRFDILPNGERLHVITVGALLNIALDNPVLDYSNLLALTGFLTHNSSDVEQMFRRMVFNYLTDNKDDHCKNFSFYMRRDIKYGWQWRLAPAYDLTLCTDGYNGEHATSVNGTGRPSANDIVAVGAKVGINVNNAMNIIKEMQRKCAGLVQYPLV